jgi:hypothetical protein
MMGQIGKGCTKKGVSIHRFFNKRKRRAGKGLMGEMGLMGGDGSWTVAGVSSGSLGVKTSVSLTGPYSALSSWVAQEGSPSKAEFAKLWVAMPA